MIQIVIIVIIACAFVQLLRCIRRAIMKKIHNQ